MHHCIYHLHIIKLIVAINDFTLIRDICLLILLALSCKPTVAHVVLMLIVAEF